MTKTVNIKIQVLKDKVPKHKDKEIISFIDDLKIMGIFPEDGTFKAYSNIDPKSNVGLEILLEKVPYEGDDVMDIVKQIEPLFPMPYKSITIERS